MAQSMAMGDVIAARDGREVPRNRLDANGQRTDPAAIAKVLLPFGGYKGSQSR